jgi:hypothetical protein
MLAGTSRCQQHAGSMRLCIFLHALKLLLQEQQLHALQFRDGPHLVICIPRQAADGKLCTIDCTSLQATEPTFSR